MLAVLRDSKMVRALGWAEAWLAQLAGVAGSDCCLRERECDISSSG